MHIFEDQLLFVQDRIGVHVLELPGGDIGAVLIIAPGLAFLGLVFFAEMAAAGFVASLTGLVSGSSATASCRVTAVSVPHRVS